MLLGGDTQEDALNVTWSKSWNKIGHQNSAVYMFTVYMVYFWGIARGNTQEDNSYFEKQTKHTEKMDKF